MARLFERKSVESLRRGGSKALLGWWLRAGADLLRSVPAEWRDRGSDDAAAGRRPGMITKNGRWTMGGGTRDLIQEVSIAVRSLLRARLWTVTALTTLIVGVGAVTGMFSLVQETLLRPLPFHEPARLVTITAVRGSEGGEARRFSLPLLEQWQAEEAGGIRLAGYSPTRAPLDFGDGPEYVDAAFATGNLMAVLGVAPVLGRPFEPSDGAEGAAPVLALSQEFWRSRFGADSAVVGRTLNVGRTAFTVVAVLGEEVELLAPEARFWMATADFPRSPWISVFSAVARLPRGVSPAVAAERVAAVRVTDPAGATFAGRLEPLRETLLGETRPVLLVFLSVVAGLLLIAGANLANLFLARAVKLSGERSIRAALGASRSRLRRAATLDGIVLGLAGGVGGLLLGAWMRRLVVASSPQPIPAVTGDGLGAAEAAFAMMVSVCLCAVLALWTSAGAQVEASLAQANTSRRTGDRRLRRVQRSFTALQVAVAFVLLTGSALLVATFEILSSVDPGFDTSRTAGLMVSLPSSKYPDDAAKKAFAARLIEDVEALPGVERAAAVDRAPLKGRATGFVEVEGLTSDASEAGSARLRVDAAFFDVLGIPLSRGRGFTDSDRAEGRPVAVVTESFARRYLGGADALGRRFRWTGGSAEQPWRTVVGVIPDLRLRGPVHEAEPAALEPLLQNPGAGFVTVLFRTRGRPTGALPGVRNVLRSLEPQAAVMDLGTYEGWLGAYPGFAEARFRALVVGLLGAVSLFLALVGVYGVTAYSVRRRTRELGIRIAMGASKGRVLGHVMAEALMLAVVGIALGGGAAWLTMGFLESFLVGLAPRNPAVLAGVATGLLAVALVAAAGPARAAARVDPLEALREE